MTLEKIRISRRQFAAGIAVSAAGVATFGSTMGMTAKSYSRIPGSNERMKIGVIGCGSMANSHMRALMEMAESDNVEKPLAHIDYSRNYLDDFWVNKPETESVVSTY